MDRELRADEDLICIGCYNVIFEGDFYLDDGEPRCKECLGSTAQLSLEYAELKRRLENFPMITDEHAREPK